MTRLTAPKDASNAAPPPCPDRLALYRWAVQDPETHVALVRIIHGRLRPGRRPLRLREDFAGTSADSVAWAAMGSQRRALAIDRHGSTLEWAAHRAERILGDAADRVEFRCADVTDPGAGAGFGADIITALNFSVQAFHELDDLVAYLRAARRGFATDGVMIFNLFGGSASERPSVTRRRVIPRPRLEAECAVEPFEYSWEVRSFDLASRCADCRIHFQGVDDSEASWRIESAFRYLFRLHTPTEALRACMAAGFAGAQVWRHTYDPARGASGVFLGPVDPASLDAPPLWTAYIVAWV